MRWRRLLVTSHDPFHLTGSFQSRYGPWAVVTGAAQGLGAAFAQGLAERGVHLVLVDRQPERLQSTAREIGDRYGVQAHPVPLDLAERHPWRHLAPHLADREVGLLVSNAALGPIDPFLEQPPETHHEVLSINCRAPLDLLSGLGPRLVRRGRGAVVLVSSLSALSGTPLAATYAASKAWTLSLAESLWAEWRPLGVHVLAVLPGPTDTPAFRATRPRRGSLAMRTLAQPLPVARGALAHLGVSPWFVPGATNRVAALLGRLLPRRAALRLLTRQMRSLYPER